MALSFVYLAFVSLLRLLMRCGRTVDVKDIELLVLRHQLEVLRRQVERPKLRARDRALLASIVQQASGSGRLQLQPGESGSAPAACTPPLQPRARSSAVAGLAGVLVRTEGSLADQDRRAARSAGR